MQGRVTVRFTIAEDGSVVETVGSGEMGHGEVASCVARAFGMLVFPRSTGGKMQVTYPIMFSPGG